MREPGVQVAGIQVQVMVDAIIADLLLRLQLPHPLVHQHFCMVIRLLSVTHADIGAPQLVIAILCILHCFQRLLQAGTGQEQKRPT